MRGWCLVLLGALAGCPDCANEDRCDNVPRGGACTSDSECVLAFCASACCNSAEACGAPMAFHRSSLEGHECLYEQHSSPTGICRKSTDCLCDLCEPPPMAARCISGTCSSVILSADGGVDAGQ